MTGDITPAFVMGHGNYNIQICGGKSWKIEKRNAKKQEQK